MPTIRRFGKVRIAIYPSEHGLPHFHLLGPDYAAVVGLESFAIIAESGKSDAAILEAMAWARSNVTELRHAWTAIHGEK